MPSIQKSLTAALLMKQVQAGNIDLATPLSRYYPQIKEADQITLKMMVDMRSGLTELSAPEKELSESSADSICA
ncbi:serine hydrolase domain-containing protein [Latilactobacillus curvatus]|uniref:serine hydrolase domain-containing protein n=1 Tax=Latilactobacillus curvatus TaxID=28038 RepID=UPI0028BC8255|nr:serine hydrolase domain-containing protein [Latilactobacillus curvatus]MDT7015597.1 serine hydrolase domain-containing protein [Latilactobacillus curvatus]